MGSEKGMFCLDFDKKTVFSAYNNPENLPVFSKNAVLSVAIDPHQGSIWYSVFEEQALYSYQFKSKKLDKISAIDNNPAWKLVQGCNALFFDRQGKLWISTWLYSAFIRNPDGRFEKIAYDRNLPYSIGYGFFSDAIQDNYGNIWLATINGVSKYANTNFVENIIRAPSYPFFLNIDFANINTLTVESSEVWWLGKMEGLVRYEVKSKKFKQFIPQNKNLRWNEIFDLQRIHNEIWCATGNGVQIFDPVTERFRSLRFPKNTAPVQRVDWIHQDYKGDVWIGVTDDAVYRYRPSTDECVRMDALQKKYGEVFPFNSMSVLETSDHKLWIGSNANGVLVFDLVSERFSKPQHIALQEGTVISMARDKEQNIWVVTAGSGIFKVNRSGQLLDKITAQDGLPYAWFNDLTIDDSGRLWAVSRENLICIDPKTKQVTPVNIDVTFSFNDHWNSLLWKDNKLYGTMLDNIVVIDTRKFQQLPKQIAPFLSGFKVFQNDVPFTKENGIHLNHRQNFFSIDFSSPFHRDFSAIQYAYKLEGFDDDWVYCGHKQTAAYTNVPHGTYRFFVKSTNANNQWMTQIASVPIIIQPPFWRTDGFQFLILILMALLIGWLYQNRQKELLQKRFEKTIDYFANSIYGNNSVQEICWDIAHNCISQLQLEDCVVYLMDEKKNRLVQSAAYGDKNPKGHEIINPIEIDPGKGIVGTVAKTGKPLLVSDTSKDERYIVDDEPRLSELAVPIFHLNKVIGVIDSEHSQKNFFTHEHVKVLSTIASISANKIAEAQSAARVRENEIKILEIRKMLAESQLMALRAQMNPHFVFNCLNSIQECIVTQKYGEASKYLNKFSKLFRTILNNSGKTFVTLEEEKEVLGLYLELEQMRFEQGFSYFFEIDEDLEMDEILLPSMLLQPYVENALWHGLMHKEGDRTLKITIRLLNEEVFQCIIEDNGIGREKSFALKAQQSKTKRHQSKGLRISQDRIEVLQKQGYHATLQIIDQCDQNGEASGTKVIIELSAFLKT